MKRCIKVLLYGIKNQESKEIGGKKMIQKRKLATMSVAVLTAAALLAGCGADKDATKAPVAVNTYKVVASDTPVRAEYSGTVSAMDKVPVQPKISGRVVEKYVQGGQDVTAGQALFRIDSRTYDAALAQPRQPKPSPKPI